MEVSRSCRQDKESTIDQQPSTQVWVRMGRGMGRSVGVIGGSPRCPNPALLASPIGIWCRSLTLSTPPDQDHV